MYMFTLRLGTSSRGCAKPQQGYGLGFYDTWLFSASSPPPLHTSSYFPIGGSSSSPPPSPSRSSFTTSQVLLPGAPPPLAASGTRPLEDDCLLHPLRSAITNGREHEHKHSHSGATAAHATTRCSVGQRHDGAGKRAAARTNDGNGENTCRAVDVAFHAAARTTTTAAAAQ